MPEINRTEARNKAEKQSKYNDMKQHADKLIQGFQKLSDSHAKRAIWELFQNAIDLSENAEIEIELTDTSLIFRHNGKPFDDNTLNCLIKQVSSKSAENNEEEIGQYGTGFITTHSFGRTILLSGSLLNEGACIQLDQFKLDRTPKTSPELIIELVKQQNAVFDLIEKGLYSDIQAENTEFQYLTESPLQKDYAEKAIQSLPIILPYVMVLNERLKKVIVKDNYKGETIYLKGESKPHNNLIESEILINGNSKKIYSIEHDDPQITIILPIEDDNNAILFNDELSKLFLYYPLIGTEQFGFNYIIHSKKFSPTEQRDGIYLNSKTEQVQENEKDNRELLDKASIIIFDFVKSEAQSIKNPINLAQINFNINSDKPLLNEYFIELKKLWIENFKEFPLVETSTGNIEPSKAVFLSNELLCDPDSFDAIYSIAGKYYNNIPLKELVGRWTEIIDEWNFESINYIAAKDLVIKIEKDGNLDKFENAAELKMFYSFLIKNGHGDFFNHYKLLPNIKGEFRQFSALNKNINLPENLIEIADVIMPDVPKRNIHPDYSFNLDLASYNRKNYTTDFNAQLSGVIKDDSLSGSISTEYLYKLIDYCKITTSADAKNIPIQMVKLACEFYNYSDDLIIITPVKDDEIDNRTPQYKLIRMLLNDISKSDKAWVEDNLDFLKRVIETGSSYKEYEDIFKTIAVFPNQLFELCVQSNLQDEEGILPEVKKMYDDVVKPNMPIRATMVLQGFAEYLKNKEKISVRSLTEKIESAFSPDAQYFNMDAHPFHEEIITIIKNIANNPIWGQYFPLINSKRANIMLDIAGSDSIKGDIYDIIGLDPTSINKIGELARNKNLDAIIALGEIAFEDERKTKADFQFKHEIGKRIENLIKDKLGKDLEGLSINVVSRQNGQDIVINYEENEVYYIEVKSRWTAHNSVMMSKNQFENAVANKDKYSLCYVDMTKYKEGEENPYEVEDVSIIFDRIKIVNTIGNDLAPFINGILITKDPENEITLVGDYKATIPQKILKKGSDIDIFVTYLITKLSLNAK